MGKSLLASKTFWVNIVAVGASIASAFGLDFLTTEMQAQMVVGIMAVANIVLRVVTKEPIK